MEWRPIETAPKDGTPIIIFARHGNSTHGPTLGWWQGGKYPWAFIDDVDDSAECDVCEAELSSVIEPNAFGEKYPPTCWMPLPPPPKEGE